MTDNCPRCQISGIPAASERRQGPNLIHAYRCAGCGHRWSVTRDADAYQPSPDCPTPGKHRYATREAATKAAARTVLPFGRCLNPYECRCGWFHNSKLADDRRYRDSA